MRVNRDRVMCVRAVTPRECPVPIEQVDGIVDLILMGVALKVGTLVVSPDRAHG